MLKGLKRHLLKLQLFPKQREYYPSCIYTIRWKRKFSKDVWLEQAYKILTVTRMIKLVSCNQITFDFSWVATWWRSNYVCKSNIDCNLTLDNFPTPRTIVLGSLNNPPRCKQRPHLKKKKTREILFPCGFRFTLFLIKSIWWALITCLSEILGCFKHCSLKGSITFKGTASQQRVLLHFYFTFSPVSGDSGCMRADKQEQWRVYGGWQTEGFVTFKDVGCHISGAGPSDVSAFI